MNAAPYPFNTTPQYPGPAMSPAGLGRTQLMHGIGAPQMQGPAPSRVGYTSLPSQGPGQLPGTHGPSATARVAPRIMPGTSPLPGVAPVAPAAAARAGAAGVAARAGLTARMLGLAGLTNPFIAIPQAALTAASVGEYIRDLLPANADQEAVVNAAIFPDYAMFDGLREPVAAVAPPARAPVAAVAPPAQVHAAPAARTVPTGNTRVRPAQPRRMQPMAAAPEAAPMSTLYEGPNQNIDDATRQRAMEWLALNQSAM